MPPRRKAAKKNVRTPKSKAKPESPPPPSPDPEPETLPDIQPESPTPPSLDPEPETLPEPEPEPEPEPVSAETPVTNDAETSTAAVEPVAAVQETLAVAETRETDEKPDSATETLEAVAEVAGGETVAEEPAASETQEMATEVAPASAETEKKKTRKVTVVKKVIKKKIVKKLVPKAAALVMEDAKVVDEKMVVAENPKEEITEVALAQETTKEGEKEEEVAEVAQEIVKEDEKPDEITEVVPEIKKEEEKKVETTEMVPESVKGEESTEMVPKTAKEEEKKEEIEEVVPESTKEEEKKGDVEMEEAGVLERKSRKKTEIFVGGLDRDAKEEDLRMVFGKAGEIVEVRMIMDTQSGKNKGYAFVRFADVSQAKKAVTDFEKVEICGKLCGASAIKGNDTLFLGNIDKKWKKEDIEKLLHGIGIEKIEAVTIMSDRKSTGSNRGFAFVEFETNKDAQNAFKKLQKKDAFGRGLNIKIAWAEPLNDPDEEVVKKVKSVYAEGIPSSWNEEKIRESFKKFGEIERIVLARNIKSAKRKDFAFVNYSTREAAILCIESFDKEELTDNGSKVNVKVSLAKPAQKGKQSKVGSKYSEKEKPKAVPRDTKASISYNAGNHPNRGVGTNANGTRSSANHELLHVLREQATWKPAQVGHAGNLFYAGGSSLHDYPHGAGGKRPFSSLGDESFYSDPRGYPRPRPDSFPGASYGSMPHGMAGSSHPYYQHQDPGYAPAGSYYGPTDPAATHQIRQGAPPYGSGSYYPGGPRHGF